MVGCPPIALPLLCRCIRVAFETHAAVDKQLADVALAFAPNGGAVNLSRHNIWWSGQKRPKPAAGAAPATAPNIRRRSRGGADRSAPNQQLPLAGAAPSFKLAAAAEEAS